jgi:hypothetical protein
VFIHRSNISPRPAACDPADATILSYEEVTLSASTDTKPSSSSAGWTFLTNHAHVLFCIAQDPEVRLRDVAARVGITERAVQRIVTDLEAGGYLTVSKEGRRNRYQVHDGLPLRHPIERHLTINGLIQLVVGTDK